MVKVNGLLGFCIGIIFGGIFVSIVVYYFMKEYCWKRTCKKDHIKRRLSDLRKRYKENKNCIKNGGDAENKKQNERLV